MPRPVPLEGHGGGAVAEHGSTLVRADHHGTTLATAWGVWLLLVMVLIMPFEKSPYFYITPSLAGLITDVTVIKLLGMLGFVWAIYQIATRKHGAPIFASPQARLFALFIAGTLVSAGLNGSALWAVAKYLAFIMFLPFVLTAVRTEDDLRRVVYTLVLALTLIFPYALRQVGRYQGGRLGVGLYEPNYLAANLLLVIPLAFAIAGCQPTGRKRWVWIGAGLVLLSALVMTSSRGGFLGLLAAGMVYAYRRLGLKGALAAGALLIAAVLPTDLGERALATFDRTAEAPAGLEASNRAHTALFWGGVRMMADAPLFGVGPQRFSDYSRQYSGLDIDYIAHNTYLELGAETGLPVLVLYLLVVATTVAALGRVARLRHRPETRELAAWAEGLRTGVIGFAIAAGFISAQYEKYFWLAVFLSIVVGRLAAQRTAPAPVTLPRPVASGRSAQHVPARLNP
jgi:O-antigen ligase